jgi:hypothetical protein
MWLLLLLVLQLRAQVWMLPPEQQGCCWGSALSVLQRLWLFLWAQSSRWQGLPWAVLR